MSGLVGRLNEGRWSRFQRPLFFLTGTRLTALFPTEKQVATDGTRMGN
jgi:hypothetical protein